MTMEVITRLRVSEMQDTSILEVSKILARANCYPFWLGVLTLKAAK